MSATHPHSSGHGHPHGHGHDDQIPIPREIAILVAGFIILCLILIAGARLTGLGMTQEPAAPPAVARFTVTGAGHIGDDPVPALIARPLAMAKTSTRAATTAATPAPITLVPMGEELFPRLIVRGIVTMRERRKLPLDTPIDLVLEPDGQRMLVDPASGAMIRLAAFGPQNNHAFDALLPEQSR